MLSEIMVKLAKGDKLSPMDLEELRLKMQEIDNNRMLVSSWSQSDKRIKSDYINYPFEILYNSVLESNQASIILNIPSVFRNIIILGSGSITNANGGNIWAQFNGDTGAANYSWQLLSGIGAAAGASEDTTFHAVALGVFGTTGAGAGVNGSFRSEIIHAQGAWKKNVLSQTYTAEFNDLYLMGSTWINTAPISKIEIFGTDNTLVKGTTNLALGSLFTVYGVK
jgi:hypothetical protein